MERLFLRIVGISLSTSVVLLPLLLCLPQIRRRWAERTCYMIWLVLALRLILPLPWTLPQPAVRVEVPQRTAVMPLPWDRPVEMQALGAVPSAHAPTAPDPSASTAPRLAPAVLMAWIWLAGAAVILLWHGGGYLLARRRLLRQAVPLGGPEWGGLLQQCQIAGVKKRVRLYRAAEITSPMTLGLLRPVILLPMEALPESGLIMILRHELIHVKRRDVGYQLLLLLCCGIHWFNPLVWWMRREAAHTLELCCDDAVVRDWDKTARRQYGELLLQAAGARTPPFATSFGSGKGRLKGRLQNLFQSKPSSILLICAVLLSALLVGGLVVCEAAGGGADTPQAAMNGLLESVTYDYDTESLSFTIPRGYDGWTVHIAGRSAAAGGMSVHYTQDTPQERWRPGKTYTYPIPWPEDPLMTALTMTVSLSHGETELEEDVDLVKLITEGRRPVYRNPLYGFTLRIPEVWDNFKIVEGVGQVAFRQADTGNSLLELSITNALPPGQTAVAQSGGWYLVEAPMSAVMPENEDPAAIQQYREMVEAGRHVKETICFPQECAVQKLSSVTLKELQEDAVVSDDGRSWAVDPATVLVEAQTENWPRQERRTYGGLAYLLAQNQQASFDLYVQYGTVLGIAGTSPLEAGDTSYEDTTHGFTLWLPRRWAGRYTVTPDGKNAVFAQRDCGSTSGLLFTLYVAEAETIPEDFFDPDLASSQLPYRFLLGRAGAYLVYVEYPSTPQAELDHPARWAEYISMWEDAHSGLAFEAQ